MRTFNDQWLSFKEACIPPGAPKEQLAWLERAFFGGAWGLFNLLCSPGIGDKEFRQIENELHAKFVQAGKEAIDELRQAIEEEIARDAKTKAPN